LAGAQRSARGRDRKVTRSARGRSLDAVDVRSFRDHRSVPDRALRQAVHEASRIQAAADFVEKAAVVRV
jgi:hypothetical protein